ncbi:probable protein phosphatase 2C 23 [Tanacetum coccineum]
MGNGVGKLTICFTGTTVSHRKKDNPVISSDRLDDLGHSFCYIRPNQTCVSSSKVYSADETTTFRSISGASVSANTATPLSTSILDAYNSVDNKASAFESSTSFASIPLQPLPKNMVNSGPLYSGQVPYSGPVERGFLSGPIERGFQSGPIFSDPSEKGGQEKFLRSFSQTGYGARKKAKNGSLIRVIKRAISRKFVTHVQKQNSVVAPVMNKQNEWNNELTISSVNLSSEGSLLYDDYDGGGCDDGFDQAKNLEWAQGKAGEDRVHVVVSEEHGLVFVGIYDGFNGPDAPDFLLSNLYQSVHKELKGLLWDDDKVDSSNSSSSSNSLDSLEAEEDVNCGVDHKVNELELVKRLKDYLNLNGSDSINHSDVLKALSCGLKKTEEAFLDIADQMLDENPELALMGSCVLVMLMKGEDVYVMNVGDSRAVIAQKPELDIRKDLERINEESLDDLEAINPILTACQLSVDHSTSIEEEVLRIKNEHRNDACAVMNDRVKGSLKVTRAFGAGFLKKPKWNNALLEMFRIDYVGSSPYINCVPFLHHHKLGPRDRFLILSSDGLYQYFTNEEAVSEVEAFIQWSPEGDPAQHLVEEVLFRAAKKAGMDFHELLEIPQGDRRRYHDDVSIIVISLEGRIWRSCV